MGRKQILRKQKITVVVDGSPVKVTLTPPNGSRSSWYVYWTGLVSSKSTEQTDFAEAVKVVNDMLQNGGKKKTVSDIILTDEEFIEIQRRHFAKKTDAAAQFRSEKSLRECLDAISAFRQISGLESVSLATPDDCESFQREALELQKNWRVQYADNQRSERRREKKPVTEKLSSNTVVKWSVGLQAAFERACKSAGKKCVRGVVPESKLLTENPWRNFTWIEGKKKELRQFDQEELISLLDYLLEKWPGLNFAPAFAKVMLWSWARRAEVSSLRWSDERKIKSECHFESTGKWGVTKWFRIPEGVRKELEALRIGNEFVFGGFPQRLHEFHVQRGDIAAARRVRMDFVPENIGDWMYHQVKKWSATLPGGGAYLHVLRKTTLQYAVTGEHLEESVAKDASVSKAVMMTSYAKIEDAELRGKSNRTFQRIRQSLSAEVAARYGWEAKPTDQILERLDQARMKGDWESVARLAQEMVQQTQQAG